MIGPKWNISATPPCATPVPPRPVIIVVNSIYYYFDDSGSVPSVFSGREEMDVLCSANDSDSAIGNIASCSDYIDILTNQ